MAHWDDNKDSAQTQTPGVIKSGLNANINKKETTTLTLYEIGHFKLWIPDDETILFTQLIKRERDSQLYDGVEGTAKHIVIGTTLLLEFGNFAFYSGYIGYEDEVTDKGFVPDPIKFMANKHNDCNLVLETEFEVFGDLISNPRIKMFMNQCK